MVVCVGRMGVRWRGGLVNYSAQDAAAFLAADGMPVARFPPAILDEPDGGIGIIWCWLIRHARVVWWLLARGLRGKFFNTKVQNGIPRRFFREGENGVKGFFGAAPESLWGKKGLEAFGEGFGGMLNLA